MNTEFYDSIVTLYKQNEEPKILEKFYEIKLEDFDFNDNKILHLFWYYFSINKLNNKYRYTNIWESFKHHNSKTKLLYKLLIYNLKNKDNIACQLKDSLKTDDTYFKYLIECKKLLVMKNMHQFNEFNDKIIDFYEKLLNENFETDFNHISNLKINVYGIIKHISNNFVKPVVCKLTLLYYFKKIDKLFRKHKFDNIIIILNEMKCKYENSVDNYYQYCMDKIKYKKTMDLYDGLKLCSNLYLNPVARSECISKIFDYKKWKLLYVLSNNFRFHKKKYEYDVINSMLSEININDLSQKYLDRLEHKKYYKELLEKSGNNKSMIYDFLHNLIENKSLYGGIFSLCDLIITCGNMKKNSEVVDYCLKYNKYIVYKIKSLKNIKLILMLFVIVRSSFIVGNIRLIKFSENLLENFKDRSTHLTGEISLRMMQIKNYIFNVNKIIFNIENCGFNVVLDYDMNKVQHFIIDSDEQSCCSFCYEYINGSDTLIYCNNCNKYIGHFNCLNQWIIDNNRCSYCCK